MRTTFLARAAVVALVLSSWSSWSSAGVILPGNPNWYEFGFGSAGTFATNGTGTQVSSGGNSQYADNPPWTFTAAVPVDVKITDAFSPGDTFSLFDNAVLVGSTIAPSGGFTSTDNPAVAYTQSGYSHGVFTRPPGAHSLTIRVDSSPFGAGAAYFRVDVSVPEPASASLLLIAAAAAPLVRRRPRRD